MKKIANGLDYKIPATIDDPAVLDEIKNDFLLLGYPKV